MDNNEQNNLIPQNKIKIYRFKNKQREGTKLVQQQQFRTRVNLSSVLSSCLVPLSNASRRDNVPSQTDAVLRDGFNICQLRVLKRVKVGLPAIRGTSRSGLTGYCWFERAGQPSKTPVINPCPHLSCLVVVDVHLF